MKMAGVAVQRSLVKASGTLSFSGKTRRGLRRKEGRGTGVVKLKEGEGDGGASSQKLRVTSRERGEAVS